MAIDLPTYLLYGEDAGLLPADVMHAESISERSSLHSWEIKPHRHEALLQIFSIDKGRVDSVIDGERQTVPGPGVLIVMPLAVHGFRWTSDARGTVFTVVESHVRQLLAAEATLRDAVLRSRGVAFGKTAHRELRAAVEDLRDEYGQHASWRATAIDAALLRLMIALGRALPAARVDGEVAASRSLQHVQRFRELVDERFREQPTLAQFAAEIGITTTQLNRVCRVVVGHPALAVLHARICLEAQRELAYTTLSIKHVAYKLGFSDAGYFTRFFERETGSTPSAWRAQALAGR